MAVKFKGVPTPAAAPILKTTSNGDVVSVFIPGKPLAQSTPPSYIPPPPSIRNVLPSVPFPPATPEPPIPSPPSTSSTVASSFQNLSDTANALNAASDQLTALVDRLDIALKRLNLGVSTWVEVLHYQDTDNLEFAYEKIGYTRVGSKWGIALQSVHGNIGDDPYDHESNLWLFTDAPRELRIKAVEKIPDLIIALNIAAKDLTQKLSKKIAEVSDLTAAIEQTGSGL